MRTALLLLWPILMVAQTEPSFHLLYSFSGENGDGAYPSGSLLIGPDGELFGVTYAGGILPGTEGAGRNRRDVRNQGDRFRTEPSHGGWRRMAIDCVARL